MLVMALTLVTPVMAGCGAKKESPAVTKEKKDDKAKDKDDKKKDEDKQKKEDKKDAKKDDKEKKDDKKAEKKQVSKEDCKVKTFEAKSDQNGAKAAVETKVYYVDNTVYWIRSESHIDLSALPAAEKEGRIANLERIIKAESEIPGFTAKMDKKGDQVTTLEEKDFQKMDFKKYEEIYKKNNLPLLAEDKQRNLMDAEMIMEQAGFKEVK